MTMAQPRQAGMFDSCLNKGYKQALEETTYRYETCCNVMVVTVAHDAWVTIDHMNVFCLCFPLFPCLHESTAPILYTNN
jgi:hypothetical protein